LHAGYHQSAPLTTPIISAQTENKPSSLLLINSATVLLGCKIRNSSSAEGFSGSPINGTGISYSIP
jgi:hypothetical protein